MRTELELLAPQRAPAIFRGTLQTRSSLSNAPAPLGTVQVADEAGFAYLSGDIDFGAIGRNEIFQNIKFIVLTEFFSVPLDREFGMDYSMVDKPMAIAEAIFAQEVSMKITLYEPRAQFREIDYVRDEMIGKLSPSIVVVLLTSDELPSSLPPSTGESAVASVPGGTIVQEADLPAFYAMLIELARVPGPVGPQGPSGTIEVGETTTGAPGTDALVENVGTSSAAIFDFTIPQGEKGDQGTGVNIKGTVANSGALPTTGNQVGDMWIASDTGHGWSWDGDSWVDVGPIQGPPGNAATIAVGSTTTGAAGTNANVANVGTSSNAVFNFTIPQGIKGDQGVIGATGPSNVLSVQSTTTGAPGTNANVTIAGTSPSQSLAFTIPRGDVGAQGIQGNQGSAGSANNLTVSGTTTGAAGTNASVVISGTTPNQSLAFTIPRGDTGAQGVAGPAGIPRGHLKGLAIANNTLDLTNDIDISEGECRDSTNSVNINLPLLITKQLDVAWVAGTGQGGRDTGAIADGTYHVFAIKNNTSGVVDALFSASATSPTLPSGYAYFRRVGSIIRASSTIIKFVQHGDLFTRAEALNYNSGLPRAFSLLTLSVPNGIVVRPVLCVRCANGPQGDVSVYLANASDPSSEMRMVVQAYAVNTYNTNTVSYFMSNTSSQVNLCVTIGSGAGISVMYVGTQGWTDRRGQDD